MPPDEETRIEKRLEAIEDALKAIESAIAGTRDGLRPGFAERVRDHDTRIASLESRTDEHARQLGIFEGRPNMSIQREVATHAGAGGAGAVLVVLAQVILERLI